MYNPEKYFEREHLKSQKYHFRGYLPHLEQKPVQVITFRLADSVPKEVIANWKNELEIDKNVSPSDKRMSHLRKLIDQYEDAGYGRCFLGDERIAKLMEETLFHHDGIHYRLVRWCIMPNHVHVMIEPMEPYTLSDILKEWKSYTSHVAKKELDIFGNFWMQEYYDRYVRDMDHYKNAISYIDNNPVKAKLAKRPSDWRWSSAYWENLS